MLRMRKEETRLRTKHRILMPAMTERKTVIIANVVVMTRITLSAKYPMKVTHLQMI